MTHKKTNLPKKVCIACGRPFAWRKKWKSNWEEVRYCSERCRRILMKPSEETHEITERKFPK